MQTSQQYAIYLNNISGKQSNKFHCVQETSNETKWLFITIKNSLVYLVINQLSD